MTTLAAGSSARPRREAAVLAGYRDDGPLARALGIAGARLALPPLFLIAAGAAPLLAVMIARGEGVSAKATVALVVGWFVVAAGASSGRPHGDRLAWAAPPALRAVEYAAIVWIGALAGGSSPAAALALLCALAFHHYDVFYRRAHQGHPPPAWVGYAAGGWDGRLVAAVALWAVGALPAAYFAAAGVLGVLFVAESAASWRRAERTRPGDPYGDDEGAP
jgi:hypothetical protein